MSVPFNEEQLTQLKAFVQLCKAEPQVLLDPKLSFFKDYLVSLGVPIPSATFNTKNFTPSGDGTTDKNAEANASPTLEEESESESDLELDMEGVITADVLDDTQVMGDELKEVTDEERDQSDEKRTEAMRAFSEQQFDEAIKLYSEAIQLNPQSALLFAKRGQVYLKLNKPNACIHDCTHALKLNCDSAAAYKFRGRAFRLLGSFEEALHDLCESLKIDYDDQTNEWLNEVKPNAEKLRQHKLSAQRRKEEKEHRDRMVRLRAAQEARAQAAREHATGGGQEGFDFNKLMTDPDIISAFSDPEVAAAFQDVTSNPANIIKYQNNPKISAIIEKLKTKFGKNSAPFSGGFPGFGGAPPSGPAPGAPGGPRPPTTDDDVGLD